MVATYVLIIVVGLLLIMIAMLIALHVHQVFRFHAQMAMTFWAQAMALEATARVLESDTLESVASVREALVLGQYDFARWCRLHGRVHRDYIPLRLRRFYLPEGPI